MSVIIVFYSTEGAEAKLQARQYAAEKHQARVYDASAWGGGPDKCDAVDIMPDVFDWQRKRITQVFGDKVLPTMEERMQDEQPVEADQGGAVEIEGANGSEAGGTEGVGQVEDVPAKAVHHGGGKWFVMKGETMLSGPHSKAEAQALAGG